MLVALGINLGMLAAAVVGGIVTGSLALLADAGHLVSDVGAILVGLLAASLAAREPTPARTFGLQRTEIIGALINGIALLAIALLIVVQAVGRLFDPPEVAGAGVLVLGAVGLAGNLAATWALASGSRSDINLEAVLRHSVGDALSSLGVVAAGAIVLASGWHAADPIASILIAGLIAAGSLRLLREPVDVLLEAAPAGIDVQQVGAAMAAARDVVEIHDLHVWTVTSGFPALSAHLVVRRGADRDAVRESVDALLDERFGIHHTTLQVVEAASTGKLIAVEDVGRAGAGAPREQPPR
jgi:cobalt-zinc-cadmium efflux system protein